MSVEILPNAADATDRIDVSVAPERLYLFSADQYDAMVEHGILGPEDRVELLEGWIVRKMGKNQPHVVVNWLIQAALQRFLPPGWFVINQDPIRAGASVPEPDLAVVRGEIRDFLKRRIGPADVGLIVEVADSTLRDDRTYKKQLYARSSIPYYWVLNVPGRVLILHSDPTGPASTPDYRSVVELRPDDEAPVVLDSREVGRIAVREILP